MFFKKNYKYYFRFFSDNKKCLDDNNEFIEDLQGISKTKNLNPITEIHLESLSKYYGQLDKQLYKDNWTVNDAIYYENRKIIETLESLKLTENIGIKDSIYENLFTYIKANELQFEKDKRNNNVKVRIYDIVQRSNKEQAKIFLEQSRHDQEKLKKDPELFKLHLRTLDIIRGDFNSRTFFYLFFKMLIQKKYFQLYFFYNFFFSNNILMLFNKNLINYLLLKMQNETELSLFIIKRGFLFNSSIFTLSSKAFFHRKNLGNINYHNFVFNNKNDNALKLFMNNAYYYNILELFKKNEIQYYLNGYIKSLFYQNLGSLYCNSNFTGSSSLMFNKRGEALDYKNYKNLFLKFFNLLINSVFFNAIPFFIFPKYLEEEVYIFYSYVLSLRTSIFYNIKYTRWLVSLRNVENFQHCFGTPCFFFILDIIESFLTISPVKNFKLPVGALVSKNINANFFDYPMYIYSPHKNSVYFYFFFILRITFYSLNKRKKFFWGFFIKNQIIYELKKRLIDL